MASKTFKIVNEEKVKICIPLMAEQKVIICITISSSLRKHGSGVALSVQAMYTPDNQGSIPGREFFL
jgi:predicted metallopeptidase